VIKSAYSARFPLYFVIARVYSRTALIIESFSQVKSQSVTFANCHLLSQLHSGVLIVVVNRCHAVLGNS
jgi:hypothetical protein